MVEAVFVVLIAPHLPTFFVRFRWFCSAHMLSLERLAIAMHDKAAEVESSEAGAAKTEKARRVLRVLLNGFSAFTKNSRSKLYSTMYDLWPFFWPAFFFFLHLPAGRLKPDHRRYLLCNKRKLAIFSANTQPTTGSVLERFGSEKMAKVRRTYLAFWVLGSAISSLFTFVFPSVGIGKRPTLGRNVGSYYKCLEKAFLVQQGET